MIRFSKKTRYYPVITYEFNLPAGWSCPGAQQCLAKAVRISGKLTHGNKQTFPCYAARDERFPTVRKQRWENFDTLKGMQSCASMAELILQAIPRPATHVRIHGGGDFFNQVYFDAWLLVSRERKDIVFWAYTKSLTYWLERIDHVPSNLTLTASYGGRHDHLISQENLKFTRVFFTLEEIEESGLPLCTDDSLAMSGNQSFALLENYSVDRKKLRRAGFNSNKKGN